MSVNVSASVHLTAGECVCVQPPHSLQQKCQFWDERNYSKSVWCQHLHANGLFGSSAASFSFFCLSATAEMKIEADRGETR